MSNLIKNLIFKIKFYFAKQQHYTETGKKFTTVTYYKDIGKTRYLTGQISYTNKESITYV